MNLCVTVVSLCALIHSSDALGLPAREMEIKGGFGGDMLLKRVADYMDRYEDEGSVLDFSMNDKLKITHATDTILIRIMESDIRELQKLRDIQNLVEEEELELPDQFLHVLIAIARHNNERILTRHFEMRLQNPDAIDLGKIYRWACKKGAASLVMHLDTSGIYGDVDFTNSAETCAFTAAMNGHLNIVRYIVEKKGVHVEKDTALQRAARQGHVKIVEYLTTVGASVKSRSDYSLKQAAKNGHEDVVLFILSKNPKPRSIDEALKIAIQNQHIEVAEVIIEQKIRQGAYNMVKEAEIREMAKKYLDEDSAVIFSQYLDEKQYLAV